MHYLGEGFISQAPARKPAIWTSTWNTGGNHGIARTKLYWWLCMFFVHGSYTDISLNCQISAWEQVRPKTTALTANHLCKHLYSP
ncbi:hypothetical protein HU200_008235 [Digitaria exilis]|uniref:Uncharacterized protein n=1 Tax=Digitaria exilis TaxID=1010633 RepID=A0A835FM06_9POAL|nr:hypothetical protein HU200_008235 [Digitaria exilis]